MPKIGIKIKKKREQLGITQEELAQKLGYKNKSTIAKIENGTNDIVQSKVIDFAKALNTSIAFLMGWEESESKSAGGRGSQTIDLINDNIEKLNNNGQKKLLDYSEILVGNPDYVKNSTSILNAAHARTDIKQTAEGQAHDDAIMMDPKEWE